MAVVSDPPSEEWLHQIVHLASQCVSSTDTGLIKVRALGLSSVGRKVLVQYDRLWWHTGRTYHKCRVTVGDVIV